MASITLRILDGADQGRVYEELPTPVTIGREEGNTVQLNDDRVSRFHLKIQEDHGKIVLTDLDSTNGTRVNGEDTHLRILRYGDMISVGRSVILVGSQEQIAERLASLREATGDSIGTIAGEKAPSDSHAVPDLEFELAWSGNPGSQAILHTLSPPDLPEELTPSQAAQLSELLDYLHIRVRHLLETVEPADEQTGRVTLEERQWQALLDLQARLAVYIRTIGQPDE